MLAVGEKTAGRKRYGGNREMTVMYKRIWSFTGRLSTELVKFPKRMLACKGTVGGAGIHPGIVYGVCSKINYYLPGFLADRHQCSVYVQDYGMVITKLYGSLQMIAHKRFYDLTSRVLDQQALDLPDLHHVFASGNDGDKNCPQHRGF